MDLNWIWFGLLIFVIIVDITTSSFTFSWLGLGFIPAFIAGYFVDFTTQIWIALILGTIAIIFGLKVSKKYINVNLPTEKPLVGKYEDREFVSEVKLESNRECRIKVNEVYWTARNIGEDINIGDTFKVLKIENNKLIIKKGVI
ncbi:MULTISPECIES: NfeD family protein [unclassified Clostridium]|uniref:NfeD family protein n=1 Tax=unclassified Clostridium TaxID=2614128 RepID=UPI000E8DF981|nr:NfeD family protein [Clostridium sp.]